MWATLMGKQRHARRAPFLGEQTGSDAPEWSSGRGNSENAKTLYCGTTGYRKLEKNNTGLAPPVRQHGKCPANALKHTSAKLRDKRDIVAAAATQSGAALQYASYRAKPIQTTETTGPRESIFTRLR